MKKKIRVGVVGCGGISAAHISGYKSNRYCELVGLADLDCEKAKEKGQHHGASWYESDEEMLEREEPDAISVCTPPSIHAETVVKAAGRGVHVLCEKPLSIESSEAAGMVETAKRNKIVFLVANCHVFHPEVIGLKKIISEGGIGKVTSYRNRFNWAKKTKEAAKIRGGALLDNGIHSIYLFRHLCGEVSKVSAFFPEDTKNILEMLRCFILLESVSGAVGVIEIDSFCSTATDRGAIIEVFSEDGSGVMDLSGESFYMSEKSEAKAPIVPGDAPGRFQGEINHFIDCIRGEAEPLIGASGGVRDIEIAERIFEAGIKGETLAVKDAAPSF